MVPVLDKNVSASSFSIIKIISSIQCKITHISIDSFDVLIICEFLVNILKLTGSSPCKWINEKRQPMWLILEDHYLVLVFY